MSSNDIISQIKSLKDVEYIILCDTDGHGLTLGASFLRGLEGVVDESKVAIISHFSPKPTEPSTSARGDVIAVLNALVEYAKSSKVKPTIYILDIPIKEDRPQEHIKTLLELSNYANVIVVDKVTHSRYFKGVPLVGIEKIDLRLKSTVFETFLDSVIAKPDTQTYDLAVLGTIFDGEINVFRSDLVEVYSRIVREATESPVEVPSVDSIKRNYNLIVALDSLLKFGKLEVPQTNLKLIGNSSHKVLILSRTPLKELFKRALEQFPIPSVEEVGKKVKLERNVALFEEVAQRGMGFKLASLVSAKFDNPIAIVPSVGFTPDKKVLIIAPNMFAENYESLVSFVQGIKDMMFEEFKRRGISEEADFPRGDRAFSIGVKSDRLEEAIKLATEMVNAEYEKYFKKKLDIVRSEFTAIFGDKALASSLVRSFEAILKQATSDFEDRLKTLENKIDKLTVKMLQLERAIKEKEEGEGIVVKVR